MTVAIDPRRADSRAAVRDVLAGPLAAGFTLAPLPLSGGTAALPDTADDVTILVRLLQDLAEPGLVVDARLGSGSAAPRVAVEFSGYSTAGTSLLLRTRGPVEAGGLAISLAAKLGGTAIAKADLPLWIALDGLSGNVGHLALLMTFEHQRLRRHLAAAAAARTIDGCGGALLDRVGAELGVPRFDSRLEFSGGLMRGVTPAREADPSYRSRLAGYREWLFPTPPAVRARLREVHPDLGLEERTAGFESAFRLVTFAPTQALADAMRKDAFDALRKDILIDPGQTLPAAGNVPVARRARLLLRDALRDAYAVTPGQSRPLAPALARALDRLARYFKQVDYQGAVEIEQGQADDGGARYELGLGARLKISATFAADLAAKVEAADPAKAGPFARGLARLLALPDESRRGIGALLAPSGLSTAIVLDARHLYVSHLVGGSMEIAGPGAVALDAGGSGAATFEAKELVPLGADAIAQALVKAAAIAAVPGDPVDGAAVIAAGAGLPAHGAAYVDRILPPRLSLRGQPALGAALATAAPDQLAGFKLKPALTARIVAGEEGAWDTLLELAFALADQGVPAAAILVTGSPEVLVAASSAPLPALGANLTLQRTLARNWASADLSGGTPGQNPADRGDSYVIGATSPGLWCVGLASYRRLEQPDPAEVRPTLPAGTAIDYDTYERMMNVLQLARPLGVAINTWRIRQRHVRLDPAAPVAALNLSAARSYRRFRQARFARPIGSGTQGD